MCDFQVDVVNVKLLAEHGVEKISSKLMKESGVDVMRLME